MIAQTDTEIQTKVPRREIMHQWEIMAQNKVLLERRIGRKPKACVKTFGCQGNVSDSEKIMGMLTAMGCEPTGNQEEADIILCNTCAVRENAQVRLLSMVGELKRLKARHPSVIVGLCGCMMQQEDVVKNIRRVFPFVELIFGTHVMHTLPQMLNRLLRGERRVIDCSQGKHRENLIAEGLPITRNPGVQAFIQIMYGCDNFCTYCIVPAVRGREVSRRPEDIISEAKDSLAMGYKELVLLGQNVNSYGKGLEEEIDFPQLLERIEALPGDFRIRFMTSHPKDCTRKLIDLVAKSKKICHNIHLPVQSGSDRILKKMNRRYTKEHYLDLIRYAREKMPDVTFTTDIIVGFPGETYEDFQQTVSLCQQVRYQALYSFLYSPRPGTPAMNFDDPVPDREKTKWLNELIGAQHQISAENNKAAEGKILRVLVEHPSTKKEGWMTGRCENGLTVRFPAKGIQAGDFVTVKITHGLRSEYEGELVLSETHQDALKRNLSF